MLKDIVDETSWGRYDFMYLRIGEQKLWISLITPKSKGVIARFRE